MANLLLTSDIIRIQLQHNDELLTEFTIKLFSDPNKVNNETLNDLDAIINERLNGFDFITVSKKQCRNESKRRYQLLMTKIVLESAKLFGKMKFICRNAEIDIYLKQTKQILDQYKCQLDRRESWPNIKRLQTFARRPPSAKQNNR